MIALSPRPSRPSRLRRSRAALGDRAAHHSPIARVAGAAFALLTLLLIQPSVTLAQEPAPVVEGRRLDDILVVARFHDGYWDWYGAYLERRAEQRRRTGEIRMQLSVLAAEIHRARARWLKLLYLENQLAPRSEYDPGWAGFWNGYLAVASRARSALSEDSWVRYLTEPDPDRALDAEERRASGELTGEVLREIDDVVFRWSAGLWGQPLTPRAVAGVRTVQRYREGRAEIRSRINETKDRQRQLIDEALHLNRALAESAAAQAQRSGDRRPWLTQEIERLDDEALLLRIQLYDAAEWYLPNELPALLRQVDFDRTGSEEVARLMRAKLNLALAASDDQKIWLQMTAPREAPPDPTLMMAARTARLQAILDLRRVLQLDPENAEARGMLVETELFWLRQIAEKLDFERRASLEAFGEYLTNRGFSPDEPAGWTESLYEFVTAVWGLGPVASSAALWGGVPDAMAGQLDATQTQAARSQVSLLAIMRLVKNGVPLTELASLTSDEIGERMTLHTVDRRPLPPARARRIASDIHATLRDLPDLRLLASGEESYFVEDMNRAFAAGYYAPIDPTYTAAETLGDLFNVHNLALLWGPGAIAKVNGQWAAFRLPGGAEMEAARRAGTVVTGRQAFASATGLARVTETFASTRVGRAWVAALARDQAYRQGLTAISTATDLTTRLSAAIVLYGGAGYLAEQAGIPGANVLVELLGEIGPSELLADVLARSGVSARRLGTKIDELGEYLVRQRELLATRRRQLDELSRLADEVRDGTVDAARRTQVQRRATEILDEVQPPTGPTVVMETPAAATTADAGPAATGAFPTTQMGSVDEATGAAATALQGGDAAEARRAIDAAVAEVDELGEAVARRSEAVRRAAGVLDGVDDVPPLRIPAPDEPKTIDQLIDEGRAGKFWRSDLHTNDALGRSLRRGDLAIRDEDLERAAEHFRAARREAWVAGEDPRNRTQLFRSQSDYADQRLAMVVNARTTRLQLDAVQRATPVSNVTEEITPTQLDEVLAAYDPDAARAGISLNEVHRVADTQGNVYFVKRIVPDPGNALTANLTPADIERLLASEEAASKLARSLELDELVAPAARFDPERGLLVTRAVPLDGQTRLVGPLQDHPEHVALAVKKEYGVQRLFRAWLGDVDGHLGNLIIGADGRLHIIDFDMATLSGTNSRQIQGIGEVSQDEFMSRLIGTQRSLLDQRDVPIPYRKYEWMARLDQQVRYEDVRETVEAIRDLALDRPGELRRILEEAGYPDVEGAMRSLTERAEKLEEVFRPLFDGGPLAGALDAVGLDLLARFAGIRLSCALPRAA